MAETMIECTAGEGIRTVRLNRPERRNALTVEGLEALEETIGELEGEESAVHVIYLEGAGPAFCAGADLDVVADLDRERAEAFARLGQAVATRLEATDAITVAGIDGPARGGGLELALACDVRVATPDATMGEPGVTFGLFGAWGGTARLPRIVGEGNALDLACTGRVVSAEDALRMGLVSQVRDEPRAVAETIAAHPPDTLAALKTRLRDDAEQPVQERREAETFGRLLEAHLDEIDALR